MSTCHNCGRALAPANKRFCQYCGAPANRTVAGPTSTGWSPESPRPSGRADRTPNRLLIACGAVLGVAVIVTVILLVVLGRSDATQGTALGSSGGGDSAVGPVPTEPPPVVSTTDSVPESSSAEPTTDPSDDPATVVRNYYTAVNNRDFQTAWQLGGDNLGSSYTAFVDGYATTASDELTVVDTIGNTVDVDLTAQWNDGTIHKYGGSYTVANGQIVSGTLHKIS
jgi:hypothetical protein